MKLFPKCTQCHACSPSTKSTLQPDALSLKGDKLYKTHLLYCLFLIYYAFIVQIVNTSSSSITLTWIPPLGSRKSETYRYCDDCTTDQALVQFASSVTSLYNSDDGLTTWTAPYKAIGKQINKFTMPQNAFIDVILTFDVMDLMK